MKRILFATAILAVSASAALAQNAGAEGAEGAMKPSNLNELGGQLRDRVGHIGITDTIDDAFQRDDSSVSLFSGGSDEDAKILEIKKIARELESQRALMIQVSALQRDLIEFAMADAAAAYQSRIPSTVCNFALEERFCDAMTSSFQDTSIIIEQK